MNKKLFGIMYIVLLAAVFASCFARPAGSITEVQQAFYKGDNPMIGDVSVSLEENVFDGIFNPILNEESKQIDSFSGDNPSGVVVLTNTNPDVTITIMGMWPTGSAYEGQMILRANMNDIASYYSYDQSVYSKIAEIIARDLS